MIFSVSQLDDSFFVIGSQNSTYPDGDGGASQNGEPFRFLPIADVFFEVVVQAVPEPITAVLTALVFAAGLGRSRHL